ncbi:hypothetical protein QVD17_23438 [Tagetes erecta]|uniref:Uncharacterized protein n=1 Tax=Tagetes erecta TaxID=13708 RepID=A0AAD8NU56_TARER|nr:hypothetical protein QVD17_23438 [Tagetes erecta]
MHEATDDAGFDTFSLSDLQIYSDPTSSSFKEEQDYGNSFSSFRFKISASLPADQEFVITRNFISLTENHRGAFSAKNSTGGRGRKFGGHDGDQRLGGNVVRLKQRWTGRGFIGGSPARGGLPRIVPVNGGVEEVTVRRKSGKWIGKLFGGCIPIVN